MESLILQRVKLLLEEKSISVNALAKQINIAQATLNPQLRGDRALSAKVVDGILTAFPEISAEWVMRGTGSMYLDQTKTTVTEVASECNQLTKEDSLWQAKYEELEKRYDQLLGILGGSVRQK